jgi:two-component sensor histidine kinase/putative methionine-R-sulfoxide reductase with GAF domain
VHQSIDLQKVLENAVQAMSHNIDCVEFVSIYIAEGQEAILKAYRGYPDWFRERIKRIPYPNGFTWKTIMDGKSIYCADVDKDTFIGPAGREMGTKSYASIPINFQAKTVGCININSLEKNAFDQEELRLLEIVAQQIETALNNAQKADALRQSEDALRKGNEELEIKVADRTAELSRANQALQVEIMERRRVEEQIIVALEEKEVLIREIQHRVKNNLQVISSLVDLQTEYLKDSRAANVFNETQTRIKSMALIHEQLYQSRDLSKIDFGDYIRALGEYLLQSYGAKPNAISLKVSVENVLLDVDTAVTCGLIINELVSNSLKHAFSDGRKGEILIGLKSNSNGRHKSAGLRYTLIIKDNGVGIRKDFDLRKPESLGLQLVDGLVRQLRGKVVFNGRGGAAFKIVF